MPHTATLTGVHGPGLTMTAKVFNNVTGIHYNFQEGTLAIDYDAPPTKTVRIALAGLTTITHTISGGQHTLTVS